MRMKKTVVKVSERGGKREKCFTAMYSFNSGIRLVLVLEDKFESLTAIYLNSNDKSKCSNKSKVC